MSVMAMVSVMPVLLVRRLRRFRRRRRYAGDAVGEGIHTGEKRRAKPPWHFDLRRPDVGAKGASELPCAAAVVG